MSKQSFSEFYDRIPYIILKAPDHFPTDYEMDLEIAFSQLNKDLVQSEGELGQFFEEIKIKVEVNYPDFLGHLNNGTIPLEVSNERKKNIYQRVQTGSCTTTERGQ